MAQGLPVIVVANYGLPVSAAAAPFGMAVTVSTNGYGMPVVPVAFGGRPVFDTSGTLFGPPVIPANTSPPVITGTTQVGQTLAVSVGTWSGTAATYTFQWKRGGANISGATSSLYLLVTADLAAMITVTVMATNAAGSASATSAAVGPVTEAVVAGMPAAPVLVWISATTDNTPNFTVDLPSGYGDTRDAADGDIVYLEVVDNVSFTYSSTDTLTGPEVTGDIIAMEATTLANATYWARARLKRGASYGPYSNVETKTIAVSTDAAETTAFLARTTGLSPTETAAYKAMINGMVADGVFAKLDCFYVFATNTATTANLNLIGNVRNLTLATGYVSPMTFTADRGYTVPDLWSCLDTGLVPSAGGFKYTLNSAGMGVYVRNNRTTGADSYAMGVQTAATSSLSVLQLLNGGLAMIDINDAYFSQVATTTAQGSWFVNRTAPASMLLYRNGTSILTVTGATILALPNASIYVMGNNNSGTISKASNGDQFAAAWIGGGFTATDVTNFQSRLNTYMTAVGANVY